MSIELAGSDSLYQLALFLDGPMDGQWIQVVKQSGFSEISITPTGGSRKHVYYRGEAVAGSRLPIFLYSESTLNTDRIALLTRVITCLLNRMSEDYGSGFGTWRPDGR